MSRWLGRSAIRSAAPARARSNSAASTTSPWEDAYLRFETPEQEVGKFMRRLSWLGAGRWPRDADVVELFCGRGSGLLALARLGFQRIEGVDLSPVLAGQFQGTAKIHVADCRALPFASGSKDVLIVQGGLHHLERLPEDLDRTLDEAARVLRPGGRFVTVEPWSTPFLRLAHRLSAIAAVRAISPKMEAFETMYIYERETYDRWLASPDLVLSALHRRFAPERSKTGWGKLYFVGRTPAARGRLRSAR